MTDTSKFKRLTDEEVRSIVFTPNDAVTSALATIEQRRKFVGEGVHTGIDSLDKYLLPGRPGELITVLGITSNYKSGLMQWWARYVASEIMAGELTDECVVYVSWEQAIEEMVAFDLAFTARMNAQDVLLGRVTDAQLEDLRNVHGARRTLTPVYFIGHSLQEEHKRPGLTLTAVAQGLTRIRKEHGLRPRMIFLDYLNQIDPEQGEDRRMQTFYNVYRCKDMALAMSCPVVLGAQANRSVTKEAWAVPGIADALETSNVEHTSDKMLSVWMPKTTHKIGKVLDTEACSLTVTENLLIVKVLKQKMGPAGQWFPLYVDPARNLIGAMDVANVDDYYK